MEPANIGQDPTAGAPAEVSANPEPERSEGAPSFFDRLFNRGGRGEARETPQDTPATEPPATPATGTKPPDEWKPPASKEEFERIYQSRRDQERARDLAAQHQTEQQQRTARIQDLEGKKRELLRTHQPWEVGEEVAELELQIQAEQEGTVAQNRDSDLIGSITGYYDHIYGETYLQELPPAEVQRIMQNPYHGPQGRQQLAQDIATALKKHYLAEGAKAERERLEKNQGYRKQLVHELGLAREEPANIPAATGGNGHSGSTDMNAWLRAPIR